MIFIGNVFYKTFEILQNREVFERSNNWNLPIKITNQSENTDTSRKILIVFLAGNQVIYNSTSQLKNRSSSKIKEYFSIESQVDIIYIPYQHIVIFHWFKVSLFFDLNLPQHSNIMNMINFYSVPIMNHVCSLGGKLIWFQIIQ